ncbi:M23 family metallopeptidase [Streptomyces sp. NPDC020681]|uniref:M23 family metallopeptidase n=1 Tax=Streptomyces sp. NPDC020681 TaxID=3365083 RepID=UPI0037B26EA7
MSVRKASDRKTAVIVNRVLWLVFGLQALASVFVDLPYNWWLGWLPALGAIAITVALARADRRRFAGGTREPVVTEAPVTGRWSALNSPTDRVPSHGTHQYGQTYAIDIVAEPEEGIRPAFAWLWPIARRSQDFPAFDAPLLAVADATVVRADDSRRDHLSRNSLLALLYLLLIESAVRALGGAGWVTGNHLVLDLGDGTYAMYAHLRHGSLEVRVGDRVRAGQQVARCGNSGNSTEPHVHFQLMDGPDVDTARGIPFRWRNIGVPANGESFTAAEQTLPSRTRQLPS